MAGGGSGGGASAGGFACSISTREGNSSRMSSASSGCCWMYSASGGRSPRRQRCTKSSASWSSSAARCESGEAMSNPFQPAGHSGKGVLEAFEGTNVTLGGGPLLDAEGLGGLRAGQLLEVAQRQDFPVER